MKLTNYESKQKLRNKNLATTTYNIGKFYKSWLYSLLSSSLGTVLLIIMINYNFTPIAETINIIKNLIVPIIYCSIDNLELQNKKNKIRN